MTRSYNPALPAAIMQGIAFCAAVGYRNLSHVVNPPVAPEPTEDEIEGRKCLAAQKRERRRARNRKLRRKQ